MSYRATPSIAATVFIRCKPQPLRRLSAFMSDRRQSPNASLESDVRPRGSQLRRSVLQAVN